MVGIKWTYHDLTKRQKAWKLFEKQSVSWLDSWCVHKWRSKKIYWIFWSWKKGGKYWIFWSWRKGGTYWKFWSWKKGRNILNLSVSSLRTQFKGISTAWVSKIPHTMFTYHRILEVIFFFNFTYFLLHFHFQCSPTIGFWRYLFFILQNGLCKRLTDKGF